MHYRQDLGTERARLRRATHPLHPEVVQEHHVPRQGRVPVLERGEQPDEVDEERQEQEGHGASGTLSSTVVRFRGIVVRTHQSGF